MDSAVMLEEPDSAVGARSWRRWCFARARELAHVALVMAGACAAVTLFGARTYGYRGVELEVSAHPSLHGGTVLALPPVGSVSAPTHATPVELRVRLRSVSFDDIKALIAKPPPRKTLEYEFERAARRDLQDFCIRLVLLGAAGGLLCPAMLRSRRARTWVLSATAGAALVIAMVVATTSRYRIEAFEEPTYRGSLRQAQWVIAVAKDAFTKVDELSNRLKRVATNINTLYARMDALPALLDSEPTITVLHISDTHNDPASARFVRELAEGSQVDLIVNTGDLTDLGSPVEAELLQGLSAIDVPYVFVAGNHDSPAVVKATLRSPRAVVLQGVPIRVAGLTILGAADPSSARAGTDSINTPPDAMAAAADKLSGALDDMPSPPDIVCVHDVRQADLLLGRAPVVLCGHSHRSDVRTERGTVVCDAGTTGAAGVRYLMKEGGVPLSAALLCFGRNPTPHLLHIDHVVLDGSLGHYSITRRTFRGPPVVLAPARAAGSD